MVGPFSESGQELMSVGFVHVGRSLEKQEWFVHGNTRIGTRPDSPTKRVLRIVGCHQEIFELDVENFCE
jgi:hypothetical protein